MQAVGEDNYFFNEWVAKGVAFDINDFAPYTIYPDQPYVLSC